MPAGAVRARDELALAQRLVGDDLAVEADRAERARVGAERRADLVLGRRADVGAERGRELRLLEPVVAAHEREHDACRPPSTTGIAFDVAAASMPRNSASASIVVDARASRPPPARRAAAGNSGARGTACATSRSAA